MGPDVVIAGVAKGFGSEGRGAARGATVEALAHVDVSIAAGEFVSVIGPSGCGKSTLLRIVAGLEEPSAGSVRIAGETPRRCREDKRIAWIPQAPGLLPWATVTDNALLLCRSGRRAAVPSRAEVEALLVRVGLAGFADAHPSQLSGGMAQRVSLVRALLLGAPLLLMDEPFAALDELTRAEMRRLLAELRADLPATVVLTTHSLAEAVLLSDRVLVCSARPGRIIGELRPGLDDRVGAHAEDDPRFHDCIARLRGLLVAGAAG